MNRIVWIDALKGVGIILVMFSHSCGLSALGCYLFAGYMSLFFIASGFTFKPLPCLQGIKKKIETLLLPYFIYGILIISFFSLIDIICGDSSKCLDRILGLFYSRHHIWKDDSSHNLMNNIQPLWFLTCLFLSYVLVYFYFSISNKIKRLTFISILLFVPFISHYLAFLLPWSFDISIFSFFYILFGTRVFSALNKLFDNSLYIILFILLITCVWFVLTFYNGKTNLSLSEYGLLGLYSIPICFVIGISETLSLAGLLYLFKESLLVKWLSIIGQLSLRIMCIHMPMFWLLSKISSDNLMYIVYIVMVIIIAVFLGKIISKFPYLLKLHI